MTILKNLRLHTGLDLRHEANCEYVIASDASVAVLVACLPELREVRGSNLFWNLLFSTFFLSSTINRV